MLKNFKKIVFRATALAVSSLCLGAFSCSTLNALSPENSGKACKYTLEDLKKLSEEPLPEYNAQDNTLGKYGECGDIIPIPQASIAYLSHMRVDENDKTPVVSIDRMLAFDKNDKNAGKLEDIKDLLDDKRKLFGDDYNLTYDLNSTENKIDVTIELYDFSKDPKKPVDVINTKMKKIPRTINGRNFIEFALEMPDRHGHPIPAQVQEGEIKLYKHDGSGHKNCIASHSWNGIAALTSNYEMFVNSILNFNRNDDIDRVIV